MNDDPKGLATRYPCWHITDISGGWVALRRVQEPGKAKILCGNTLHELRRALETEERGGEVSHLPQTKVR